MPDRRVLLVSILPDSHRNLSCLALFSALSHQGIDTKLLFLPRREQYQAELLKGFILAYRFHVVGLSVMTEGFAFARMLTEDIKHYLPTTHVVWGGIHPTSMPDECLRYADSVCIGEGELSMASLVEAVCGSEDITTLPGIGTKLPGGKVVVNAPPPLIHDLDSLSFCRYDWNNFFIQDDQGLRPFGVDEYRQYSHYEGEDYTLMATRSCPFSCAYCANSLLNELYGNHRSRKRSIDHVLSEIRFAREHIPAVKFINFIDDQFLTSKSWNVNFVERYHREVGLPFIVRLVPGTFNEDDLAALNVAGLAFVQVGIQSGSERTHKEIFHRPFKRDTIIETSRMLSRHGIHAYYDVIIQNDFEDDSDRDKTIELLLELEKPFSLTMFTLTPFPRTRLEALYREKGIIPKTDPYGRGYSDYDEEDFYFQLASVIPTAPDHIARFFFEHSKDRDVQFLLKQYYRYTRDQRTTKITARDLSPQ